MIFVFSNNSSNPIRSMYILWCVASLTRYFPLLVCCCIVCSLLQLMVSENSRVRSKIQPAFEQLLKPHLAKVDEAILPGLTSLSWTSLNIDKYLNRITTALGERLHFTADFHDHIRNIRYSKWPQVQYVDTQLYTCRTFNIKATANYWKLVLTMSLKQLPLFLEGFQF